MKQILQTNYSFSLKKAWTFILMSMILSGTGYSAEKIRPSVKSLNFYRKQLAQIVITGTVKDAKQQAIPGVSVKLKGTNQGTSTDVNGNYRISLPLGTETLIFSSIGFETQEITVSGRTTLNVVLKEGTAGLEEVVVIGYGTVKKRDLTGSVVSVKSEEITARPGPNPMESLQGRVAGLDISRSSGQAGEGVNLQLRGTRSISASGLPLFIINGLPGDYATLNPNDIETIDVLKDAASTAVYGASGANGVIIITTKSGKSGKLNIDFNSYYGYNGWSVVPDAMTKDQYLDAKREAYKYNFDGATRKWVTTAVAAANGFPAVTGQPLWQSPADDAKIFGDARYALFNDGNFVNWADIFMRDNAALQNYSLAASGGTDATKAYVSFNLNNEKGQYIGDDYKLYSTSMRLDHKIRNWLSIGANLQASYVNRNKAQDKLENAIVTDPLVQPYKADGSINPDLGSNVYNLLLDYQPGVYGNVDNNTKVFFNPYIEIRPIKGLTILSRGGVRMDYLNNYRFDGVGSVSYTYVNSNIARAKITQNRFQQYQWENVFTYNYLLEKDHDFTFTGVTSFFHTQETKTDMSQAVANNKFKWYRFSEQVNSTATSSYTMSKTFGLMGRINYAYKGKYLFSASLRRDGSSVLYETNKWDNFPAVSAGWRVSDENFMAGTKKYINNLKVRATWGIAGTAYIPANSSSNFVEQANMSLGGEVVPIYRSSQFLTNPNLVWEKSKTLNLGLDVGLFNNRIDMAIDYYNTNTDGVIYNFNSPIIYGAYRSGSTPYQTYLNIAKTNNKGFELTMNTRNIVGKNFEWTSSIAFSRNHEEILKLSDGTANNITNNVAGGDNRVGGNYALTIGQPIASFRNYKIDGIWQIGEEADAGAFGRRPGDLKVNTPGIVKLADGVFMREGTNQYYYTNLTDAKRFNPALTAASSLYTYNNTNDFQTIGHNTPDFSLGFQNSFKYKNFDLGIYSYLRWGQTINYVMMGWYNPSALAIVASPPRTFLSDFNYWTPENPSNDFPVMNILSSPTTMTGFSGLNYVDGSFFKIKNITVGYTLPENIAKKIAMRKVRFYSTLTNPLVITKSHFLKDYDPEMNGEMDYPLTKQFVFGLNVSF